ncbi:MAG: bifunctional 1-(5-phosphoribosyl)-5-((5-phosphoribosylamino)methylideneamino)imidazole-4-carboxamide isomerase/phosphoribosylanthranilate isomerase PriA [Micrococcales bacterium]|nr:bifunctional 1-(5-phosphoribosyl)-5-((5-phosphoribosylamino)methylideneamino)imidazole-4-carboxamide isomerase/phosphoribosylanthranilate isomerase PriA [Micrococcales bacterium]
MAASINLIPAVDLFSGKSVRLSQGELGSSSYEANPFEIVESFIADGSKWIHLADLDEAFGNGDNQDVVSELVTNFSDVSFQLSGGIRNGETLERALKLSPARINLSSSCLSEMSWVEKIFSEHSDVLAFGLDVLDGHIVPRGKSEDYGSMDTVLSELENFGVKQFIVTDVSRDGMLSGPNLDLLKQVFDKTGSKIISSGGISTLEDIAAIRSLGFVDSLILGKALYVGKFNFQDALKVAGN